jgi:glycine/D-amino acid oxidase-like deaminating enzyme
MRVGILGGGLQGCCTALALAERAAKVTLFDKNDSLLSRAAVANEGKDLPGLHVCWRPNIVDRKNHDGWRVLICAFP